VAVGSGLLKQPDKQKLANVTGREHFFAVASRVMRRILVDYARSHHAQKRGGHQVHEEASEIPFKKTIAPEELLALDQALARLATWDERESRIVELRFFGGLTEEEIASALNISVRTVKREWAVARAWLQSQLKG
jgi:RNA polymerase sigma factor (TIGR02999 family)